MALRTVHGIVAKDGRIISGEGFKAYKVDSYSFRLVFDQYFDKPPTVVASIYSEEINNGYYETDRYSEASQGCIVSGLEGAPITHDGFSVFFQEDMGFNFIAMGEG